MQQFLAIIILISFVVRLIFQKKKKEISQNEFIFWLIFWIVSLLAIIFIKKIDYVLFLLGFSGSGIEILFYVGVIVLFYLVFKIRIKIEKTEKNITKITRALALDEEKKYDKG